jgi:predicted HicB family RNase H-like nuclease
MTPSEDGDQKMVGTRVDPELHRRVRVAAAMKDQTISQYLRELLDEHVPQIDE